MEEIRDVGGVEDEVEDVGECKEASGVGRGEIEAARTINTYEYFMLSSTLACDLFAKWHVIFIPNPASI